MNEIWKLRNFSNQEREFLVERITLSPGGDKEFYQSLKKKIVLFLYKLFRRSTRVKKTNFMRLPV